MLTQSPQLVGKWEKVTRSTCSQIYPEVLQFQEGGGYFGQTAEPGMFTQWDVGTYEVEDADHIKISTANDSIVTYQFFISDNLLTFLDANQCEFQYRKAPQGLGS